MEHHIFNYEIVKTKNIKIGNKQKYNNTHYFPIYYNDKTINKNKFNPFIFKTCRLFINNVYDTQNNKKKTFNISLIDKNENKNVLNFYKTINRIEKNIKNTLIKNDSTLINKNYYSFIKDDIHHQTKKFYLQLSQSNCILIDINKKVIEENKFSFPTYGYLIIQVKNIWTRDSNWGINFTCKGGMILPSELIEIPKIKTNQLIYLFQEEIDSLKTIGQDEKLKPYFKMKKMGVPVQAIKNKMIISNIEKSKVDLIDLDEKTTVKDSLKLLNSISDNKKSISNNPRIINKKNIGLGGSLPFLNSIKGNSFNLKSVKSNLKSKTKQKISEYTSFKQSRVPSLQEIQNAIKKLKKS